MRTDNMLILNSRFPWQITKGESMLVWLVNFSKTVDFMLILNSRFPWQITKGYSMLVCLVNFWKKKRRFYVRWKTLCCESIKYGIHDRKVDTMRSLFSKGYFRVTCNGTISNPAFDESEENQGGNSNFGPFRQYLADLSDYLSWRDMVTLFAFISVYIMDIIKP